MSVSSSLQQRIKTHGADPDDSGDDWEIGVGNLIIDLDADLEKDRQRLEMNRVLSVKSAVEASAASEQPFLCKEPKKFKLKRRNSTTDTDRFPSLEIVSGIPKVCVGKRREAQGRGGEMNSAPAPVDSDEPAPLVRTKDGKKGKTQSKGVKREKDSAKTRKEKPNDEFGPLSENGSALGGTENLIGRGGMDAAIVDHTDDTSTEEHSLKTVSSHLSFRNLHVDSPTARFVKNQNSTKHLPCNEVILIGLVCNSNINRFSFVCQPFPLLTQPQ
uniref:Uncharacterized protein n=1 Tax=Cyprinus carpio TaxID=7962 RepID=A0A8C2KZZ0_CYPCA